MTVTLLLDLDDTLLGNDIDRFLPAYIQALGCEVAPFLEPKRFADILLHATGYMVRNRRPDYTLQQVFDQAFYPALGVEYAAVRANIERFYASIYPTLRSLTRLRPEAQRLVQNALERGYRLVVATNPLFPQTAILQRLEWAGLPAERYPFELVTSYEKLHFSKPSPLFLAEVLGQIGWPEGPVVVVGDSLENDIQPARRLGLATFWLSQGPEKAAAGSLAPLAAGTLDDLLPWIDRMSTEELSPTLEAAPVLLDVLRTTPAILSSLVQALPARDWTKRPAPGEWSVTEILCHLRDVEAEVNLSRIEKVLQENNPFLPGKDTDPWAEERHYIEQDGPQALQQFTQLRLKVLEWLTPLTLEAWERQARHAILGPTRLIELARIMFSHERLHIRQVRECLGSISV